MGVKLEDVVEEYLESVDNGGSKQAPSHNRRIPIRHRRHNPVPRWLLPMLDVVLAVVSMN